MPILIGLKGPALTCAALLALAACTAMPLKGASGPVGTPAANAREQTHRIPLALPDGRQATLLGRTCRPDTDQPARVVVIAHGSPPVASARPSMQLTSCDNEAVRWFTGRGYLVAVALRRGYGGTGGESVEAVADCSTDNYARSAQESARDVAATVAYATALPYARHDGAIVVGQSAGGWAALGLNAAPHPDVIAIVSMAGGRGGHAGNRPYNNCHPENLAEAAGRLGQTASTPMLWIYTANDTYFIPSLAQAMHQAFTAAGGKAEFHALPAFAGDGHTLFFGRGGSLIWGPLMERYLQERGAT